jgi:hypothetical protein
MLGAPTTIGKMSFRDMAEHFIGHVMHSSTTTSVNDVQQVHIIFDKYMEDSIEGQTCTKKGEGQGQIYHLKAEAAIPQNCKQILTHR